MSSLLHYDEAQTIETINDTEFEADITADMLNEKISQSPGPDSIGAEFYINTANEIYPILKDFFNSALDSGTFSAAWGRCILCPIHKSGPIFDPCNFRGISLINTMYEIFFIILNKFLFSWAEENGKLDEAHSGFRSGYSLVDNICAMIQKYLSRRGSCFYCLYVDFQKVFDKVQHQKLLK